MTRFNIDRRDLTVVALAVVVIAVFALALASKGLAAFKSASYLVNLVLFIYVGFGWLVIRIGKILIIDRPASPLAAMSESFFRRDLLPRYISAAIVLACLVAFMPAFSAMKSSVPLFNDYSWDVYFINLDRQIHGGDPWRLLQPLIGFPIVTAILAGFYHLWLILLYVGSFYFLLHHQPALRQRYFLSYFLCWSIIGAGMAIAFSSVGPCFVQPMVGRDDFVPLMQYLRQADQAYPILVLDVQDMLLQRYQSADGSLGSGITAMPSMHVAQAFLFFLAMRHVSRRAAWAAGIFFLLILIGSVHLAYHYAVDGYVAVIGTGLIWLLAGWISKRGA